MFPEPFDYYRAESVAEALDLMADHADREVELLAGGHSLVPAMKAAGRSPDAVVDLAVDALAGVQSREERVVVGALTTYADLMADDVATERAPLLAAAAREVGDRQIRNRGTLGGNLAEAHPAADPPAAALAADATVLLRGRDGKREVPATDFFRGDGETAVGDGELLTAVRVPDHGDVGSAYVRKTHPATGYAMVGAAALVDVADGVVAEARVAATGAVDRAVRLPAVERAAESADPGTIERAAEAAADTLDPDRLRSDPHASGRFRASLLETHVERALAGAVENASADRAADAGS